jgi:hypothetical protein
MKTALWKAMVAAGTLTMAVWAQEEGPGRGVARISVINGDVSVRRGDSGDWIAAAINAPLVVQDRVFCGPLSRAELQFDFANMVRIDENSEVRLSELEYQRYQVQVARGTVTFRVLRDSRADVEISTPSVSVRPVRRGSYRVTVRGDGTSEITVRSGEVEVYTPRGAERLTAGRTMLARGSASDPEFQIVAAAREDDWDRWNERRDHDLERTRSYQYVSSDIYGAEDLDAYGEWVYAPGYGWVWAPRVAVGWAPYRYGRWSWIDWYGWSWVSYDPWGWAPYHYGRWFYHGSRWCWWPGAIHGRHYWSPALVGFFGWGHGGFGIGVGFGNVGWVPLAPYEPYYPWYGHRYYSGYRNQTYIDNSFHVVNNVNITNVYRNSRVNNAVTAVNAGDFARGRTSNLVRVSESDLRGAGQFRGQLPLAPDRESLRMADREVRGAAIPRGSDHERFFARRQPAAVDRVAFDDQRRGIEQATRRTFGESRAADQAPAGGRVATSEGRGATNSPGGRVANTESRREAEPASGWRRMETPTARGAEAAPGRTAEPTDRGSWRRFSDSGRVPETSAPSRTAGEQRVATPGDTGRRSAPEPSRRESNDSWRRFESPPRTEAPARTESPRSESPRYERREAEPVRISPPIVRERPTTRSEDRGSMSRMPESRSQMSAPPARQESYSAPRPQMSAPAPRQQMSSPTPRGGGEGSRGGGGGGGGRTEGRSSGRGR